MRLACIRSVAAMAGHENVLLRQLDRRDAAAFVEDTTSHLSRSSLWWVSSDMCRLLDAAAPSMPAQPLLAGDVPDPWGVVFFENPLRSDDSKIGGDLLVSAMSWAPVRFARGGGDGLVIVAWTLLRLEAGGIFAHFTGQTSWAAGANPDALASPGLDLATAASHAEDRRRLAALWTLSMQESIVETTTERLDSRTAAKAARRNVDVSPMKVLRLRRHRSEPTGGRADRSYSHRWLVSGHWRNQYLPSRGTHRLQWIAPYVKGPEDKPLVVKETVKAWTR